MSYKHKAGRIYKERRYSLAFPTQWLDELLSKNDIADVISSYVELKPKGRKLWGLCPLHGEKTPSFSVSPDKQLFYCFGCHAGGTVIQFIMDMEKLTYGEAVRFLAERAHMELPEEQNDAELQRKRAYRRRLQEANRLAARFFCQQLLGPLGQPGRLYAQKRGMNKEILLRFGIGYAPESWDLLKNHLMQAGYSQKELEDAGLLVLNREKGRSYDVYRNRLIFPIQGIDGQVLGFGGRVLDDSKPKYLNTGDTLLYNKRNNLYGLHLLKGEKLSDIVMVEGYMDVIGLYKAGVRNAVASLGTALTVQQARLLKRYVQQVYIAYDGDSAGQHATIRGLDILSGEGLSVKVIVFPDDLDPDEFAGRYGREGFERLKSSALTLSAFKLDSMAGGRDMGDEDQREQYAKEACAYVASLQPLEQERYYRYVAEKTGYPLSALKAQGMQGEHLPLEAGKPLPSIGGRRRSREEETAREALERTLLQCALQSREAYALLAGEPAEELLETEAYRTLLQGMGEKEFSLAAYIAGREKQEAEKLSALLKGETAWEDPVQTARECIRRLEKKNSGEELSSLQERLKEETLSPEEKKELLKQITALIRANK